jgi:hypothetical protein
MFSIQLRQVVLKRIFLESLVSFALVVMFVSTVYAAPPTLLWSDAVETNDIVVSEDGQYVAAATASLVKFYSRSSGTALWQWSSDAETFFSVAISADGNHVAAGGSAGRVYFWKNARTLTGNPTPTWTSVDLGGLIEHRGLDISGDGNYVTACGSGEYVFYWANAKTRSTATEAYSWRSPFFDDALTVDLSSDGDYVASGGSAYVAYWKSARTLTGNPQDPNWKSTKPTDVIVDVTISDDGNYVAAAGRGFPSPVYYWANAKSLSGNPSTTWESAHGVDFSSIDMSSDGDSVIAGAVGPSIGVYFWSGARGKSGTPSPSWTFATTQEVEDVAIDSTGEYMAAANDVSASKAYFFDKGGNLLWNPPFQLDNPVTAISLSGDGGTLAVGTAELTTAYLLNTGYSSAPRPVAGIVMPTNKLEILTPYLALAGVIAALSAIAVVKRRKT